MSLDQYSQVPASNDLTNYFKTGMAPSSVKIAGWDIMADLASRLAALTTGGGSANTQTLTQTRALASLVPGLEIVYLPGFANTGATTFQPDGVTAKNVFAYGAALLGGEFQTNVPAWLKYDGTQWNLLNPNDATGSFTATLATGLTTTPTGTINWRIVKGKTVIAWANSTISGTSNATGMTITGIPAALVAANDHTPTMAWRDSGARLIGAISGVNGTTWTALAGTTIVSTGFTNTGSKGWQAGATVSYPLD